MKEETDIKGATSPRALRKRRRFQSTPDWTKLERRGAAIVLVEPSNSTVSSIKHDYDLLYWATRKLDQYVNQHAERGEIPTLDQVKHDFKGTILVGDDAVVGYATDAEVKDFLEERKSKLGKSGTRIEPISSWAEKVISTRWGFTHSAGATYIRRAQPTNSRPPRSKRK